MTANLSVTATFAVNTYTLTYTAGPNGTITGTTPQTVNSGASGSPVTAVPNTGYHFVSWSDGLTTASRTDSGVTANLSVTATFAVNTYTLTYTAGPNGTITGTTPQTVNSGASGSPVTAVPNTGYHFVSWSDGLTTASRTDSGVTANLSVTATFAVNTYTLTYTAGPNGTITGTTPQTVNSGASGSPVTAVPNTGYHFVSWSDGLTTASRTDSGVTANLSVTATFAANTYTLTYTAGPNGTITGTSPQTVNSGASGSPVTAVPNTGYHFVSWSDGLTTASRTDSGVTANLSVTATFAANTYTVTPSAGTGGNISPSLPQTVNYNATTSFTVTPSASYAISSVNGCGGSLVANTYTTGPITASCVVTASFAQKVTPVVIWLPVPVIYGTPLGSLQLDAFALAPDSIHLVPGTFVYTPQAGVVLGAGEHQLSATFTPTNTTEYQTATVQATLVVAKALPKITWPQPAPIISGTPLSATQLNATANVPGTFTYSPVTGTVLKAGTYVLQVSFTPSDSSNYQTWKAQVALTVKSR